jgi:hypothetical protein
LHNRMFQCLIVPALKRTDEARLGWVRHRDEED